MTMQQANRRASNQEVVSANSYSRRSFVQLAGATALLSATGGLLSACGGDSGSSAKRIGFITYSFEVQFFRDLASSIEKTAGDAGYEVIVLDPQGQPGTQVKMMEDLITQNVEAIIVDAVDPQGLGPSISSATEADIPVFGVDGYIDNPQVTANVGTANFDASKRLGEYAVDWLNKHQDGQADLGIVFATTTIQIERNDGFKEAVEALPDVSILQEVSVANSIRATTTGAEDLIQANPSMNTFFATGGPGVLGALAALESRGRAGEVAIFGWDPSPESLDAIESGDVVALVLQRGKEEGVEVANAAIEVIEGGTVSEFIEVPVTIVTDRNVDDARAIVNG